MTTGAGSRRTAMAGAADNLTKTLSMVLNKMKTDSLVASLATNTAKEATMKDHHRDTKETKEVASEEVEEATKAKAEAATRVAATMAAETEAAIKAETEAASEEVVEATKAEEASKAETEVVSKDEAAVSSKPALRHQWLLDLASHSSS
jgi:hypothetical protein